MRGQEDDAVTGGERERLVGSFPEMVGQLLDELRADSARLDEEEAANAEAGAEAEERRAERARSGELGEEWRIIQRRIDAGLTSVPAVFSGEDTSREAQALRDLSRRNLQRLRQEWEDREAQATEEAGPREAPPHVRVRQAAQNSRARHEEAAARIADALRAQG